MVLKLMVWGKSSVGHGGPRKDCNACWAHQFLLESEYITLNHRVVVYLNVKMLG